MQPFLTAFYKSFGSTAILLPNQKPCHSDRASFIPNKARVFHNNPGLSLNNPGLFASKAAEPSEWTHNHKATGTKISQILMELRYF